MGLVKIKNIAFLGYDFFYSTFENLLENGYDIKWLFTNECDNKYNFNQRIIYHATQLGATISFNPISKNDIYNLIKNNCDLIIAASYPFKIPIVEGMPPAINIHPTMLPKGRGPWPIPCTILKGLTESGVTIHKVDASFDTGDILIQKEFSISELDNLETLSCKSQIIASQLCVDFLKNFEHLWLHSKPQGKGSYWKMPTFEDRELKWENSIWEINRVSRAFGKFDSLAQFDNSDWIIKDLTVWQEKHNLKVGTVAHKTNKEIVIAAIDGFVCLRFFELDLDI